MFTHVHKDCLVVRSSERQVMVGSWVEVASSWHGNKGISNLTNGLACIGGDRLLVGVQGILQTMVEYNR